MYEIVQEILKSLWKKEKEEEGKGRDREGEGGREKRREERKAMVFVNSLLILGPNKADSQLSPKLGGLSSSLPKHLLQAV